MFSKPFKMRLLNWMVDLVLAIVKLLCGNLNAVVKNSFAFSSSLFFSASSSFSFSEFSSSAVSLAFQETDCFPNFLQKLKRSALNTK